jgi:hypothetical protein
MSLGAWARICTVAPQKAETPQSTFLHRLLSMISVSLELYSPQIFRGCIVDPTAKLKIYGLGITSTSAIAERKIRYPPILRRPP